MRKGEAGRASCGSGNRVAGGVAQTPDCDQGLGGGEFGRPFSGMEDIPGTGLLSCAFFLYHRGTEDTEKTIRKYVFLCITNDPIREFS